MHWRPDSLQVLLEEYIRRAEIRASEAEYKLLACFLDLQLSGALALYTAATAQSIQ